MIWPIVLFVVCSVIGAIALRRGPAEREGEPDPNESLYHVWLLILLTLSYLESGREAFYKPNQFYEIAGGYFARLLPLEVLQIQLDEMERERLVEATTFVLQGKEEVEKAYKLLAAGRRWIEYGPVRKGTRPTHGPPPRDGYGV